jgi:two-component system, NarL family, nitrate/nitrite response regulator NarL
VIADTRVHAECLADVLGRQDGLRVVATAGDAIEAIGAARRYTPEVAAVDLGFENGLAATRSLTIAVPTLRVVALSVAEDVDEVIAWAEAGISAYVPRNGSVDLLVAAMSGAVRGELACSSRMAAALLHRVTALTPDGVPPPLVTPLTPRERQIVVLIDEGLGNKEIAARLQIQVPTVKNHVHHILQKLGAHRRSEAAWRLRKQDFHSWSGGDAGR